MANNRVSLSEQIRRAIRGSGLSRYRICKEIGITQPNMTRFMHGTAGLSMQTLDKIAGLLDLNVIAGPQQEKE
jgi:transcriptional regulator with XRE-family HTH domain